MTITGWEKKLATHENEYLIEFKNHLLSLKNIILFYDNFKDTGIFVLIPIIDNILLGRTVID
jgi:hypothetical protein